MRYRYIYVISPTKYVISHAISHFMAIWDMISHAITPKSSDIACDIAIFPTWSQKRTLVDQWDITCFIWYRMSYHMWYLVIDVFMWYHMRYHVWYRLIFPLWPKNRHLLTRKTGDNACEIAVNNTITRNHIHSCTISPPLQRYHHIHRDVTWTWVDGGPGTCRTPRRLRRPWARTASASRFLVRRSVLHEHLTDAEKRVLAWLTAGNMDTGGSTHKKNRKNEGVPAGWLNTKISSEGLWRWHVCSAAVAVGAAAAAASRADARGKKG